MSAKGEPGDNRPDAAIEPPAQGFDPPQEAIRLLVHGDDFGLSAAVNRGIWAAFSAGVLTAASLTANGEALEQACDLARGSVLTLGLHLNLTSGRPVLPVARVRSLVDRNGFFPGKWGFVWRTLSGRLKSQELTAEMDAQYARVAALGVRITHLDSHHHVHLLPAAASCAAAVMSGRGIGWVRRVSGRGEFLGWNLSGVAGLVQHQALAMAGRFSASSYSFFRSPEHLMGLGWYLGCDRAGALQAMLRQLRPGCTEWMCHPADFGEEAAPGAAARRRQREGDLLSASSTRRLLEKTGIKLVALVQ